jgi:hypothetical protein
MLLIASRSYRNQNDSRLFLVEPCARSNEGVLCIFVFHFMQQDFPKDLVSALAMQDGAQSLQKYCAISQKRGVFDVVQVIGNHFIETHVGTPRYLPKSG